MKINRRAKMPAESFRVTGSLVHPSRVAQSGLRGSVRVCTGMGSEGETR